MTWLCLDIVMALTLLQTGPLGPCLDEAIYVIVYHDVSLIRFIYWQHVLRCVQKDKHTSCKLTRIECHRQQVPSKTWAEIKKVNQ